MFTKYYVKPKSHNANCAVRWFVLYARISRVRVPSGDQETELRHFAPVDVLCLFLRFVLFADRDSGRLNCCNIIWPRIHSSFCASRKSSQSGASPPGIKAARSLMHRASMRRNNFRQWAATKQAGVVRLWGDRGPAIERRLIFTFSAFAVASTQLNWIGNFEYI